MQIQHLIHIIFNDLGYKEAQNFLDNIAMDESSPFFVGEAPNIYDFDAEGGMAPYNKAVQEYSQKLYDNYDRYMEQETANLLGETLIPAYKAKKIQKLSGYTFILLKNSYIHKSN